MYKNVRTWAREAGIAVGARGRLSVEVIVKYLGNHEFVARELAKQHDIPVHARGRIARSTLERIAAAAR